MQSLETSTDCRDSTSGPSLVSSLSNILHIHREAYPWKAREKRVSLMSARSDKQNAKQQSDALNTIVLKAPLNFLEGNRSINLNELTLLATNDNESAGQQQVQKNLAARSHSSSLDPRHVSSGFKSPPMFPMKLHAPEVLKRDPQLIAPSTDRSPFDAASRWRIAALADTNCQLLVPLTACDKYHRREKRRVRPRSRRACHWRAQTNRKQNLPLSLEAELARRGRQDPPSLPQRRYAMDLFFSSSSIFSCDRWILPAACILALVKIIGDREG